MAVGDTTSSHGFSTAQFGLESSRGYPAAVSALVVYSPDVETELGVEDLPVLFAELSVLVRPDSWYDAAGAAAHLAAAEGGGLADLREWEQPQVFAFARALDHIRDTQPASEIPEPRPLAVLRDRVIAYAGLEQRTYDFTLAAEVDVRQFFSYTGAYGVGDRLVAPHDHGLRLLVTNREPGDRNDLLTCEFEG